MRAVIAFLLTFLLAMPAVADAGHNHGTALPASMKPLKLSVMPEAVAGGDQRLVVRMTTTDGTVITPKDLSIVHTKPVHLLMIDRALNNFHHLHPIWDAAQHLWRTESFTPRAGVYHVFADITPVNGAQIYLHATLVLGKEERVALDETESRASTDSGVVYHPITERNAPFDIRLVAPSPIHMGDQTVSIVVEQKGKPVQDLEPVLGAFAHVVGFYADGQTVVHAHPLGAEPADDTARGTSPLAIHLNAPKKGYMRLFIHVRHHGQDIVLPFGVNVE